MDIISFYGTDGSGKTTIAKEFASLDNDSEYVVIGGSSYKSWLTPEVAKNTLGSSHRLAEVNNSTEDMIRLYEDIAIACYGLARNIADKGTGVVIDSDPYLKRIIWETLHLPKSEGKKYTTRFEERMTDHLGAVEAPDYIVGVNMRSGATTHEQLLGRLSVRESNSSHDPTEIHQVRQLDDQVREIWQEIELATAHGNSQLKGFNHRLRASQVIHVENPDCQPHEVALQMRSIAEQLDEEINDQAAA